MPPLQLLIKPSSGMCNLRCRYCFYCDVAQNRMKENYGFMSRDTMRQVVKKALAYADGTCGFAFQGGEPTLIGVDCYRDFLDTVKEYNTKNLSVSLSLQTNGYKLGDEWAEMFAENRFLVGVSVDGVKATHDSQRLTPSGEGSFSGVMETIDRFNRHKVEYNILTVVHAKTAAKIRRIYEFYKKNHFHYQQYIACLDPLGETRGESEFALEPALYGKFLTELFDLWYADWKRGRQPYIRQFENYIGILLGYPPEACDQRGVCGITNVVEADGSVYPCDFYMLDAYRLGNFNENRLDEIDAKREEIGFVERSRKLEKRCLACPYYRLCRGGCQRHRDPVEGTGEYHNYFCESYRIFFDACLGRMEELAGEIRRRG